MTDMDTDARCSHELAIAWMRVRLLNLKMEGREWTEAELAEAYAMKAKGYSYAKITEQLRKTNPNRTREDVVAAVGDRK